MCGHADATGHGGSSQHPRLERLTCRFGKCLIMSHGSTKSSHASGLGRQKMNLSSLLMNVNCKHLGSPTMPMVNICLIVKGFHHVLCMHGATSCTHVRVDVVPFPCQMLVWPPRVFMDVSPVALKHARVNPKSDTCIPMKQWGSIRWTPSWTLDRR